MENSQLVAIIKRLDAPVPLYLTDDLRELGLGTLEGQLIDDIRLKKLLQSKNLNSTILILLQWKSTICLMTNS